MRAALSVICWMTLLLVGGCVTPETDVAQPPAHRRGPAHGILNSWNTSFTVSSRYSSFGFDAGGPAVLADLLALGGVDAEHPDDAAFGELERVAVGDDRLCN